MTGADTQPALGLDTLAGGQGDDTTPPTTTASPEAAPAPPASNAQKPAAQKTSRAKRPAQRGAAGVKAKVDARRAVARASKAALQTQHVVMQTSRFGGPDGQVPRHRVALASKARAKALIDAGEARDATAAEIDAARAGRGVMRLDD